MMSRVTVIFLECRHLENPANGVVTITGNTAHYKCNTDYNIEGDIVRTCQDKAWTGSAPICTKGMTINMNIKRSDVVWVSKFD